MPLSRRGGLTGQFESRAISLPEALVAAWAFRAGDKLAAALLLFPRLDDLADDRWLGWIVRDMIGHACHQQMLAAFSHSRDYPQALALARHLSQPLFEGYQYQDRAVELAAQLARREEDFKTFVLPPPDEWTALQKKLSRAEQIEFLASHLRLLNCFQWGQPGGVNLEDPQFATPHYLGVPGDKRDEPEQVINPYVELLGLKLAVADLPALLPRVLDEDFLPTFSYWRDFHPSRTMYRVNELAASVINDTAKRELVSFGALGELDAAERQAYLGTLLKWCQDNRDKTREDLLLDTVTTTNDWRQFARAAAELVHDKSDKVLPILVERSDQFGSTASEDDIVELCYRLDSPAAAAPARNWLTSAEKGTRFWAALILLGHGDQDRLEGLDVLAELLANDSGSDWYPRDRAPLRDRQAPGARAGLRHPGPPRRAAPGRNPAAAVAHRASRGARLPADPAEERQAVGHDVRRPRRPGRAARDHRGRQPGRGHCRLADRRLRVRHAGSGRRSPGGLPAAGRVARKTIRAHPGWQIARRAAEAGRVSIRQLAARRAVGLTRPR